MLVASNPNVWSLNPHVWWLNPRVCWWVPHFWCQSPVSICQAPRCQASQWQGMRPSPWPWRVLAQRRSIWRLPAGLPHFSSVCMAFSLKFSPTILEYPQVRKPPIIAFRCFQVTFVRGFTQGPTTWIPSIWPADSAAQLTQQRPDARLHLFSIRSPTFWKSPYELQRIERLGGFSLAAKLVYMFMTPWIL